MLDYIAWIITGLMTLAAVFFARRRATDVNVANELSSTLNNDLKAAAAQKLIDLQLSTAQLEVKYQQAYEQSQTLENQLQDAKQQDTQLQSQLSQAKVTNASLQAKLDAQHDAHQIQLQQQTQTKEAFDGYLKQFAESSLKQQASQLSSQNQDQLGHLLNPLKQQLGDFRKKVDDVYDKDARDRAGLTQQI
jgi:DNA recombination protein RmuC